MFHTIKTFRMGVILFAVIVTPLLVVGCQPEVVTVTEQVVVTQEVRVEVPVTPVPEATEEANLEPIKIGLSSAITGPLAAIGERYVRGMTLAIEDLGGEIQGHPLELVTADNKCNPTDGATAQRQLIDNDQVVVSLGGGCSGATLGMLPIIAEGETPNVTVASTNPTIFDEIGVGGNEWAFRINIDDTIMAKTFSPYIAQENSTIFTIAENTDFGRGAIDRYLVELPAAGVEVLGSEYFDLDASDLRAALTRVKSMDPDAILIVTTEPLGAVILRQIREVGIDANIYSRGSLTTPLMLELTSDDPAIAEGVVEASFWAAGIDRPTEQRWEARWEASVNPHAMLSYYGTRYVIAPAIECALNTVGEATREAIRDCLELTSVDTPIGHLEFDDHNQAYPNMTLSTILDGNIILLATIEPEQSR